MEQKVERKFYILWSSKWRQGFGGGAGGWGGGGIGNFTGGNFLPGEGNLRKSDFDDSKLFQN